MNDEMFISQRQMPVAQARWVLTLTLAQESELEQSSDAGPVTNAQ